MTARKHPTAAKPLLGDSILAELIALYENPDRHYHGLGHIDAMLALAQEYRPLLADPEAVEAAIWFHDAIYDSRAADNEARSAALARRRLARRADPERLHRIAALIEATATHTLPEDEEGHARRDAELFLDMDLAILGAPAAAFDRYEAAVRREYGWVSDETWRAGRAAVLEKFLARPAIFHTETFRRRFEARARKNLRRSLQALRSARAGATGSGARAGRRSPAA